MDSNSDADDSPDQINWKRVNSTSSTTPTIATVIPQKQRSKSPELVKDTRPMSRDEYNNRKRSRSPYRNTDNRNVEHRNTDNRNTDKRNVEHRNPNQRYTGRGARSRTPQRSPKKQPPRQPQRPQNTVLQTEKSEIDKMIHTAIQPLVDGMLILTHKVKTMEAQQYDLSYKLGSQHLYQASGEPPKKLFKNHVYVRPTPQDNGGNNDLESGEIKDDNN